MGLNTALRKEILMKKFMKKTKYLQWEEEKKMEGHRHRIRRMKPAVDNNTPNMGPKQALEQKKQRQAKERLGQLEESNVRFLRRLSAVKHRKPGSLWRRKASGLMRGDAYDLKVASTKLRKYKGNLEPPLQSTKRVQEQVVNKVVFMEGMDEEGQRWLRKWLSRDKDVPVDMLDYSKTSPRTPYPSPRTDPKEAAAKNKAAPPNKNKKGVQQQQQEVFKEPKPEDIVPRTSKLSLKDLPSPPSSHEWDATPPSSNRWSSPPSTNRWKASPRTPPSSHRWSIR